MHLNSGKIKVRWIDTFKHRFFGKEKEIKIILKYHQKRIIFIPVLIVCFFTICTGCGQNGQEMNKFSIKNNKCWFKLEQGKLVQVKDQQNIKPGSLLPWSVQERITDIVLFKNRLYFSVNGYGILACSSLKEDRIGFTPYYDHHYFEYKTVTTLLPVYVSRDMENDMKNNTDEHIVCHLYFNSMVFPFPQDDILFDSANIIKLTHTKDELFIQELYPVPPEKTPHWEIVGFLPVNKDTVHLEWKNSQKTYTEFRYSSYSVHEQKEKAEDREDFLHAYNFTPLSEGKTPEPLRLVCERIMAQSSRNLHDTTFHFLVEEKVSHITHRYIKKALVSITDEDFEIVTVRMFEDELAYYALVQTGFVYFIRKDDNTIRQIELPHLPEGFCYTGFFIHDKTLLLAWEESIFMNVGAAGLLLYRDELLS